MSVAEFQKQLALHIKAGGQSEQSIADILQEHCRAQSREELSARLTVYQNNFYHSLIENLQEAYPTIFQLVGKDFFTALSREFIRQCPPVSPLIFEYGEDFPEFIENFPALNDFAYMVDSARLDWLRHRAWYAADSTCLEAESFAGIEPGEFARARLRLRPSVGILQSAYAIFSIWESNHTRSDENIDALQGESVLVFHNEDGIQTWKIAAALARFLTLLQQQSAVGEAMETVMDTYDNFNASAAVSLLASTGLCSDLQLEKTSGE